jgi:methylglyoxal synthase
MESGLNISKGDSVAAPADRKMNIALIANDKKKELMVQFCIAYRGILCKHDICATSTTGRLVAEATGLPITLFMLGSHGGDQQVGARIAYNEIDLLLFFRDPLSSIPHENDISLLRLCDMHTIPVATNLATAEVLIQGLARGDLDWRNIINPIKKPL